jgi:hypothetical protein
MRIKNESIENANLEHHFILHHVIEDKPANHGDTKAAAMTP